MNSQSTQGRRGGSPVLIISGGASNIEFARLEPGESPHLARSGQMVGRMQMNAYIPQITKTAAERTRKEYLL